MKLFTWRKDGGPQSRVHGFFIIEIKSLFSVVLLRFSDGTRPAYHSHAFSAISWLLSGELFETLIRDYNQSCKTRIYWPSLRPIITPRSCFHQVSSSGTSWAISFRGPWAKTWEEIDEERYRIRLTHGRKVVS